MAPAVSFQPIGVFLVGEIVPDALDLLMMELQVRVRHRMRLDVDAFLLKLKQIVPTGRAGTLGHGNEVGVDEKGPGITILLEDRRGIDDGALVAVVDGDADGVRRNGALVAEKLEQIGHRDHGVAVVVDVFHL